VNTTTRRATRRISRSPATGSCQWWMVLNAIAASKDWSSNGRLSAAAATHGAEPSGRSARMTADGSTAVTSRPGGS
jgi:hypothetical protein